MNMNLVSVELARTLAVSYQAVIDARRDFNASPTEENRNGLQVWARIFRDAQRESGIGIISDAGLTRDMTRSARVEVDTSGFGG